ncbi:MAG: hypothetical protein A2991_04120 [Candidatus Terrybacteria bacterium RIFCSPLOWO2_01_FULL_58_14]|uniref:Aminopeptidase n=2 Tax=Candidatus Terryibacteriota TaxID=1817920 RepID=A0A1G2PVX0_9BACT|nr:MAG: hypothetical protein A2682_03785 [Candidatus Terrybacteria bacterium RIFCSPHIGHO2_01_FULL_58_15]OHA52484.1 MAG: hypothetical protein A2991_04120 [Candidatus Terrybacteria bacterium RIFCSPLOWO2_01_FULL_58_14]
MTKSSGSRIAPYLIPKRYRVRLEPDLNAAVFSGEVEIELTVLASASEISLHAKELAVETVTVRQPRTGSLAVNEIVRDDAKDLLTLRLSASLTPGPATLVVRFSGILNDKMRGFYRSTHTLPGGTERVMAVTQFEPVDARRAFPCFDEPAAKATFRVILVVPQDCAALSNMPVAGERVLTDGRREVRFAETPKMSTYLLAFIVGDLESIEAQTRDGVTVRVWTTPGKADEGRFALETGVRVLEHFTDYFGIPYPLRKLDMVAVPDFEAGAMENWGLITYREPALLFLPSRSSIKVRRRVALVVVHEIAHQWFGNLVTMAWWDGLWLNESFADFMAYKALDVLFPEWEVFLQFVQGEWSSGMGLDALKSSHPIRVPVEDPAEIDQIFDAISYSKGASVLRMLEEDFLGEAAFRQGVHAYLTAHAYGNAETEDLWEALAQASGRDVATVMDSWTKQVGFPVIHAERKRRGNDEILELRQERFLVDRDPASPRRDRTLWKIPVGMVNDRGEENAILMNGRTARVVLPSGTSFVKLNPDQAGFYRVCYAPEEEALLKEAVAAQKLSVADRLGLVSDAYALMRAHYRSVADYLSFLAAYRAEPDESVWSEILGHLSWVAGVFEGEQCSETFAQWAREFLGDVIDRVGWDPRPEDDPRTALLRERVLTTAAMFQHEDVLAEAQRRFDKARDNLELLHPDIRAAVFTAVAQGGGAGGFISLRETFERVDAAEEKVRLLVALGSVRDPALVTEVLRYAFSDCVRPQDSPYVFLGLRAPARDVAWRFVRENLGMLHERFGHSRMIGEFIAGAIRHFSDDATAEEIEIFFAENPVKMATMMIAQELESVRSRAKFRERNRESLLQLLAAEDA